MAEAWRGFVKDGHWDVDVNVRCITLRKATVKEFILFVKKVIIKWEK